MGVLDLPYEIFRIILIEAVQDRESISDVLELRLVCKQFSVSDDLIEDMFTPNTFRRRIRGQHIRLGMWPWLKPYLERRLADKRTLGWPRLHTIRTIAENFAADDGCCDGKYEMYASRLLQHAAKTRLGFRELFLYHVSWGLEMSGFNYLVAAILMGRAEAPATASLWTWTCVCGKCRSIFGSKYEAAVSTRDAYAIERLIREPEGPRNLLRYAIKHEEIEIVKRMLNEPCPLANVAELWHGISKTAHGKPETGLRERILTTPNVGIFELVFIELQYCGINALSPKYVNNLIRNAAWEGWTDMVQHLILRGAPIKSIISGTLRSHPLEAAFKEGHDNIVRLLVDHGTTMSMWDPSLNHLLHAQYFRYRDFGALWQTYAARKEHEDIVQIPFDGMESMTWGRVGRNRYRTCVSIYSSLKWA